MKTLLVGRQWKPTDVDRRIAKALWERDDRAAQFSPGEELAVLTGMGLVGNSTACYHDFERVAKKYRRQLPADVQFLIAVKMGL